MHNIKILDCTLRDGGYINDWEFGHNTLVSVFERLTAANIDFIELGFLDSRRDFDINRSIMPDTSCMAKIYGGLNKLNSQLVGMIDYGTCDIENIQPCSDSILDGIRVIFKKHIRREALNFCRKLKNLGYKVFTQAVSITSYNDVELLDLIELVNEVKPYAVSIVDTYGLLHKNSLFHYYEMMNMHLDDSIGIGYHSHNNFQLGYANSIELMNSHIESGSKRILLCDGSIFGMGKGAGNAPTELLAMYKNDRLGGNYDISQILEGIDSSIMDFYSVSPWGYSMKFFIAASNDCHPNYVSYLLQKKTLSVKAVNEILKNIKEEKKLLYDGNHIEELYIEYQRNTINDSMSYSKLSEQLQDRECLIIGPGATIIKERLKIEEFINRNNPIVISINFLPDSFHSDFVFITNSKRYVQQATSINSKLQTKIIATSNISHTCRMFDFVLDYESLIDRNAVFMDNSFIMLLKVLKRTGVSKVALAGLDGYSAQRDSNYYSSKMEYDFAKKKGDDINKDVNAFLSIIKENISIEFITSTVYEL